jgi:hypothetical protein
VKTKLLNKDTRYETYHFTCETKDMVKRRYQGTCSLRRTLRMYTIDMVTMFCGRKPMIKPGDENPSLI